MGISEVSASASQSVGSSPSQVGVFVLKKAIELDKQTIAQLTKDLPRSAVPTDASVTLGRNIDLMA